MSWKKIFNIIKKYWKTYLDYYCDFFYFWSLWSYQKKKKTYLSWLIWNSCTDKNPILRTFCFSPKRLKKIFRNIVNYLATVPWSKPYLWSREKWLKWLSDSKKSDIIDSSTTCFGVDSFKSIWTKPHGMWGNNWITNNHKLFKYYSCNCY